MAKGQFGTVLQHIRRLLAAGPDGDLTDRQLLDRFRADRDEAAFAALVQRHGPMVQGVCRRALADTNDADDAFQATFLVFAKKAGSIRKGDSVGGWLYGVATRIAARQRADAGRRRKHERQAAAMQTEASDPQALWPEVRPILDEEVSRLPEKYRLPIVLRYLQGKSHEETALELGCPPGTLSWRLAQAREMLAQRLTRRGLAFSAASLGALLAENTVTAALPPALATTAAQAGLAFAAGQACEATAQAILLAEGAMKSMLAIKLKAAGAVLLALGVLAGGGGLLVYRSGGTGPAALAVPKVTETKPEPVGGPAVNGLKLILTADKTRTMMKADGSNAEPVRLKVAFANVGDKPIKLNTYLLWPTCLTGEMTTAGSAGNQRISWIYLVTQLFPAPPKPAHYIEIKPGQQWSDPGGWMFPMNQKPVLKPGVHRIKLTYRNALSDRTLAVTNAMVDNPLAAGSWTGPPLTSNELVLDVLPAPVPPLPEAKTTPWGKEVDGLSCRLILPAEVTHGQPIRATIEIRNNSKRTRYLCDVLNPLYKELCTLQVTDPEGKALAQNGSARLNFSPNIGLDARRYPALAAGECCRLEISDLRSRFSRRDGEFIADGFRKDGKYTLTYTYSSPKIAEPSEEQKNGAFVGTLEAAPVSIAMRPMKPDDLTVHEWGVFSVFSDVKWANLNHKQEWLTLPADFYRQFPTRRLLWHPAAVRKPIIYFYTKQPSLEIDVKVKFSAGAPVVWWPACASPTDTYGTVGFQVARPPGPPPARKVFDALRWSGFLGDTVPAGNGRWSKVEDFKLPSHAWLQDARLPNAARFTAQGISPRGGYRHETERFIYYDGLVPAPDNLRCTGVTDAAVTVKNTGKFPIGNLFLVDRRGERTNKDWAVAHRTEPIPAGAAATIPLQAMRPAKGSVDLRKLTASARQVLLNTGLHPAEADSILKIWQKDFFEADGLTAFWLLPQPEYDRILPLEVTPTPANRPVRTGIIHQPHFEMGPRVRERVDRLIRQLDAKSFSVRDAANRELEELGPWVVPQVREALAKKPSLETARRLEAILQKADASEWLKQTVPEAKKPAK